VRAYYRMFVAYLRTFHRMGLVAIPMRAETGPIGGDLSHEFIVLAETGESGVFCHADLLDKPIPAIDTDFRGDLKPIFDDWTSLYAATDDMVDHAEFERACPRTSASPRAASRSGTPSISAPSIPPRWAPP
jgi:prolyl-tRNA synthetase